MKQLLVAASVAFWVAGLHAQSLSSQDIATAIEQGRAGKTLHKTCGAPFSRADMAASFDLEAFKAIPHRDVEVVIFVTDAGERRCKVTEKERRALR